MTASADDLVERARRRIRRVGPHELCAIRAQRGLVVDIRPEEQRALEGELPGAICVERNVLEWRLDPTGRHRLPEVTGYGQPVVVICSEGWASSLAAATLAEIGYQSPCDLVGGYRAWRSWFVRHQRSVTERRGPHLSEECRVDTGGHLLEPAHPVDSEPHRRTNRSTASMPGGER